MKQKTNSILLLILFILFTEAVGFASAFLAGNISESYALMTKAPFSPPAPVFGIVWPILYLLIAVALFLIIKNDAVPQKTKNIIVALYLAQLLLNFVWSPLFFGKNLKWMALPIILVMVCLTALLLNYYRRYSALATICLIPYLLWLFFATYLNIAFALLN